MKEPELESGGLVKGQVFPVLGDGFVRVVDYMGNDAAVVQAARVSHGAGTKRLRDDASLIRFLLRNSHTTPFEMCEIKLHVRVPMDCWRQWIRHRTANVNEYSTRYSLAIDSSQTTPANGWRRQSQLNRQGSEGHLDPTLGATLTSAEAELQRMCRETYANRLSAGVAREQARKDLPLSTFTEAYWKIDLHNLLHFLQLRMASTAQWEIRQYANLIGNDIVAHWVPVTWGAFVDYRVEALTLSRLEVEALRGLLAGESFDALGLASGLLERSEQGVAMPTREGREFIRKLGRLGIPVASPAQEVARPRPRP